MVVAFSGAESTVCGSGGTAAAITFARDPGDLPPVFIKFDRLTSTTGLLRQSNALLPWLKPATPAGGTFLVWFIYIFYFRRLSRYFLSLNVVDIYICVCASDDVRRPRSTLVHGSRARLVFKGKLQSCCCDPFFTINTVRTLLS